MHTYVKMHERRYERYSGVALTLVNTVAVLLRCAASGNTGAEKVVFLQAR